MPDTVAKIAVQAATYWIDKPYDYRIPDELLGVVVPGMRVSVPFSIGNRVSEGIVVETCEDSEYPKLKAVLSVLDDKPVLTAVQLRLAMFMKDRFFCTYYDAIRAMLPAGMWFKADGSKKVNDKYVEMVRLAVSNDEAEELIEQRGKKAKQQAAILNLLCTYEAMRTAEVLKFAGCTRGPLNALVKEGVLELYSREVFRRPVIVLDDTEPLPELNDEQRTAYSGLSALMDSGRPQCALLYGVTGSGKTSVYIHLIQKCLSKGQNAILLVPEIALTPQMIKTFSNHFGNSIAVLHSSLSHGERYDEWKRIKAGKAQLVIGTRSAVFAPTPNLGLIIIDEEQEETYKSENSPRYHAREVAKFLCTHAQCALVLGSATPEIETYHHAQTGRYSLFRLEKRYNRQDLPKVLIADMREDVKNGNQSCISSLLYRELAANLERGEQSILFLNRRGTNKLINCGECGYVYTCPRCSVALTYHGTNRRLVCHYCGFSRRVDSACPDCGGVLRYEGVGTQLVADELNRLFPGVAVLRMDSDSLAPVGSHDVLFERFKNERIPFMVGTQMVTKGLNFENVTLVGVISADQSLYAGEYKASERTFSLITQVVGRSGRGSKPGRAVIQSYTPENETIHLAAEQDYLGFYDTEIKMRKLQMTPPFSEIYAITAVGEDEGKVIRCCREANTMLTASIGRNGTATILGPVPLSVVKVNDKYRYRVSVYAQPDRLVRRYIRDTVIALSTDKRFQGVTVYADNNPMY